jgi:hypothetical protein
LAGRDRERLLKQESPRPGPRQELYLILHNRTQRAIAECTVMD